MKFINRQQEISRLNKLIKSEEAEMAVIWGRRRMGKTRSSFGMGSKSQWNLLYSR